MVTDMANLVVSKDNSLITACYSLSVIEQRIILLCIAKIDSRLPQREFTVTVDDMVDNLGVDKHNAYNELKSALKRLYERTIILDMDNPHSEMRWISKKVFFKGNYGATISFTPEILPFLTELKDRFTSYRLRDVSAFKCSYSFRFYEMMMQWKCKTELTLSLDWIRSTLRLGDKYSNISEFKRNVINPSISDINQFSNVSISYTEIRTGREITHLVFKYHIKSDKLTDQYISEHAKVGESWSEARKRLSEIKKDLGC